jgi:hypothetical protein
MFLQEHFRTGSKRLPDLAFEIKQGVNHTCKELAELMPRFLRAVHGPRSECSCRNTPASFSTHLADVEWRNVPVGTLVKTVEGRGWTLVFVKVFLQEHFRMRASLIPNFSLFSHFTGWIG